MGGTTRSNETRAFIALLLLIVAAIGLRLTGIGFLLPQRVEPDGHVLTVDVRIHDGDPTAKRDTRGGLYPQLIPWIVHAVYASGRELHASVHERGEPPTLAEHLTRAAGPRLRVRLVVALLSVLVVPATYLLARRFVARAWALVAAALMATSVLNLWFAQQARPHGAAASFAMLAMLALLHLRRRGGWFAFALAGVALGLALAALQSGLALLPALLVAVCLRAREAREASPARTLLHAVLGLALCAAIAWLAYPFVFQPDAAPNQGTPKLIGTDVNMSGHFIGLHMFRGGGFDVVWRSFWSYEPLICVLTLGGIVLYFARTLRRRAAVDQEQARDLAVVLAYVLPYLALICLYTRTYQRFLIPLLPYFACASVVLLAALAGRVAKSSLAPLVRTSAIALLVLVPLGLESAAALQLASIRAAPDTLTQAAGWLAENTAPGDKILTLPTVEVPLLQSNAALDANVSMLSGNPYAWSFYQRAHAALYKTEPPDEHAPRTYELYTMPMSRPAELAAAQQDPGAYLRDLSGKYALITVFNEQRYPLLFKLRAALQQTGVLVARFSPDSTDGWFDLPLAYQDEDYPQHIAWTRRVLQAHCTGPVVEIYALESP